MLCNAFIHPHACSVCYSNLSEKLKKKIHLRTKLGYLWTKDIIYPAKSLSRLTGCLPIKGSKSA